MQPSFQAWDLVGDGGEQHDREQKQVVREHIGEDLVDEIGGPLPVEQRVRRSRSEVGARERFTRTFT